MKPLERVGPRERAVVEERRRPLEEPLERYTGRLEPVLRALLAQLVPAGGVGPDLARFVDATAEDPLGRGDRPPGVPPLPELLEVGLAHLARDGFSEWEPERQRDLIARMRRGEADRELGWPAKQFVSRLLDRALAGYLSHPDVWERIGFHGPAYPEGYAWIGPAGARARHDRAAGWKSL